jgi:hypothetical protein
MGSNTEDVFEDYCAEREKKDGFLRRIAEH